MHDVAKLIDEKLLDEAAHWLARMHASDFSASEQAALEQWCTQSAAHAQVWRCAQHIKHQLQEVPSTVGMAVLNRPASVTNRRHLLRNTALTLVAVPVLGWLTSQALPWQAWSADYRTAKGQRRTVVLADGSRITLNTASAISTSMRNDARLIDHYEGEILVETAHNAVYQHLPFIVQTRDGQMQALGTKFIVRQHEQGTTLSVLEGAVRAAPAQLEQSTTVHMRQQLRFTGHALGPTTALDTHAGAWSQGVLYAENMRLEDFLRELGRYRNGVLHCTPEVAGLQVSGVYQLSDTDRILHLLAQTLPVRLQMRTRYWVSVVQA